MRNFLDLSNKTILITGGCGAIGQVIIPMLIEHGAKVAVNDLISPDKAAEILQQANVAGPNVAYFQADTTQAKAVEEMYGRIEQVFGLPNVVCCHAGIGEVLPIEEYPLENFDRMLNINLRAAFIVAQAAVKRWLPAKVPGHLIFTTSWVQDVPWPKVTPYSVSKSGMRTLMRGFARELAPHQIRANAIAPGIVGVGMAKQQWDTDANYRALAEKAIPLGYLQPAETVAQGFLFLCSDLANYMTGSVLLVDGGCSLYPMNDAGD